MWYASYMKEGFFDMGADMRGQTGENGAYDRYRELGGIINEKACKSALEKAEKTAAFHKFLIGQAENIARHAGIVLDNSGGVDPRVKLYAVLRSDNKPEDERDHHSQMSDQRLFAEAVRMLGDADSLNKIIAAYPHISF